MRGVSNWKQAFGPLTALSLSQPNPPGLQSGADPAQIAKAVGRTPQTLRNVIRAFHDARLACLSPKSSRSKSLRTIFDDAAIEGRKEMLHQSPRNFDQPTDLWTRELTAQVSFQQDLSPYQVSTETIRSALKCLGQSCQRAKHWIVSPDSEYMRKRGHATG